ncbi:MAG: DEAD/DEAH box helicase [Puniceicoccales bacterium]|jgi:superfamily II DNA or RNA helicase|nr:DEAD/DEAH box helicase [Puniceicoccales bacterium]
MSENAQPLRDSPRWTPAAIDAWMQRLSHPYKGKAWSAEELKKGREIYEAGTCTKLELQVDEALARFWSPKERIYVVVDASGELWRFHSSVKDPSLAVSYQVATVLLIEGELLAYIREEASAEGGFVSPSLAAVKRKKRLAAQRPRLEFRMRNNALEVRVLSLSSYRGSMVDTDESERGRRERESWLRFLFYAKRAGFVATHTPRTYALRERERLIHFYRRELPKWKMWSEISCEEDLDLLLQNVHTVALQPLAKALDAEHVSVEWTIPELPLAHEELQRLKGGKEETVFLPRCGWVRLSQDSLLQMTEWKRSATLFPSGILPPYMLLSSYGALTQNLVADAPLQEWLKEVNRAEEGPLPVLPNFLRPYQREGVEWICRLASYHLHGLLADDMGLGKTLQVLVVLERFASGKPSLVVCPAGVVDVWYGEAKKFFPKLSVAIVGRSLGVPEASLRIASYTQLRMHRASLTHIDWNFVVLDEAQWIKNERTKTFQACLGLKAKTRLALTGTPIENRLQDLWNLFRFLMPGFLGSWNLFQERLQKPSALEELRRELRPFILRRSKEEVLRELPAKSEIELSCPLLPLQQHLYTQTLRKAQEQYREEWSGAAERHRFSILAQLMRLRQLACDPALVAGHGESPWSSSGKLLRLESKLSEAFFAEKKVVIFSQFVRFLARIEGLLQERFPQIPRFQITGATARRGEIVQDFQSLSGPAAFLISLRAGGVGITLTAADYVFLMDPWWNPSVERQAIDRVHRWGQKHSIIAYRFISSGTLEEQIQQLKAKKEQLFRHVLDPLLGPGGATDFFLKHLQELLREPKEGNEH